MLALGNLPPERQSPEDALRMRLALRRLYLAAIRAVQETTEGQGTNEAAEAGEREAASEDEEGQQDEYKPHL